MASFPISAAHLMFSCTLQSAAAYAFFSGHRYTLPYGEIQSDTDTRTSPATFLGHRYNMDHIASFPYAYHIPTDDTLPYGDIQSDTDTRTSPVTFLGHRYNMDRIASFPN